MSSLGTVTERIHVFLGTKAQYIKTAPLLRLMDERGVDYRLIDSGQHAALSGTLREELGVRRPDYVLGGTADVTTVPQALRWAGGLGVRLLSPGWLRREVFGGQGGIVVVHGDTPSTLLSTLMAHRAGLPVAHLEAGLRSHKLFHPFPEELIRLAVMRLADVLFAPNAESVANLEALRVRGEVVQVGGNTVIEALRYAVGDTTPDESGPVVVTMHRVENLHIRRRIDHLVTLVSTIAASRRVLWVLHGPTRETFERLRVDQTLRQAGVEVTDLMPHHEFAKVLCRAPYVITDGGSIQEECALLGTPTLLWRLETERSDGLGQNVVLSRYDRALIAAFLANPEAYRRPPRLTETTPSEEILKVLLTRVER